MDGLYREAANHPIAGNLDPPVPIHHPSIHHLSSIHPSIIYHPSIHPSSIHPSSIHPSSIHPSSIHHPSITRCLDDSVRPPFAAASGCVLVCAQVDAGGQETLGILLFFFLRLRRGKRQANGRRSTVHLCVRTIGSYTPATLVRALARPHLSMYVYIHMYGAYIHTVCMHGIKTPRTASDRRACGWCRGI